MRYVTSIEGSDWDTGEFIKKVCPLKKTDLQCTSKTVLERVNALFQFAFIVGCFVFMDDPLGGQAVQVGLGFR